MSQLHLSSVFTLGTLSRARDPQTAVLVRCILTAALSSSAFSHAVVERYYIGSSRDWFEH